MIISVSTEIQMPELDDNKHLESQYKHQKFSTHHNRKHVGAIITINDHNHIISSFKFADFVKQITTNVCDLKFVKSET